MRSPGRWPALRVLLFAQLRQQPARLIIMIAVIALGVALGTSVYLVNTTAVDEFTAATRQLVGEADVVVRGAAQGFPEALYPRLAADPRVRAASPVLEIMAAIPGRREPLRILGIDVFRASALQPDLLAGLGRGDVRPLFAPRGIWLTRAAVSDLGRGVGSSLPVAVGNRALDLRVLGVLSGESQLRVIGLMDIASAQWSLGWLGRLNRVDLRLRPGVSATDFIASIQVQLPAGAVATTSAVENARGASATRAYRVNLNMLALVALLTAGFLVFSIQSLAMLRRRSAIALLRALGVTRGQLQAALLGEGLIVGACASALGVAAGVLLASVVLHDLQGDIGNAQLRLDGTGLHWHPLALVAALIIGTLAACAGTWLPARTAAQRDPARGLKAGDIGAAPRAGRWIIHGTMLLLLGTVLLAVPAHRGLPIAGYGAVAMLLLGAVLWIPAYARFALQCLPDFPCTAWRVALEQLRGNRHTLFLSLTPVIVSFAFMVSMAIMVYSFRQSFEHWLDRLLPADIQLRLPFGSDTARWDAAEQRAAAAVPGVSRLQFRRTRSVFLRAGGEPVTLIARDMQSSAPADILPLVAVATVAPQRAAWISEVVADRYARSPGQRLEIPIGASSAEFTVAGIWRDYARSEGALVIDRSRYQELSGDTSANEGSVWLLAGADPVSVTRELRQRLGAGGALEIRGSGEIKQRSLQIFDRAFAVTYAMEGLAVLIGLAGISVAASFAAIARRAEFGMLRHLGMLRRQILTMLAAEGLLSAALGVLYGVALGLILSLVLVFVINRQSFNWSIDLALPLGQLSVLACALIAASAITAVLSGRRALGEDALRAVREDW